MNNGSYPTHSSFAFFEKTTEPKFVAYTRFRGVLNAPSRLWMVSDWARRMGYRLVGSPQCVFYPEGGDPEKRLCEIQWEVAEVAASDDDEIGLRWLGTALVIATYHSGRPAAIHDTTLALEVWGWANNYQLTGARCEVYHHDLKTPSEHWITEIQLFVDGAG